MPGADGPRDKIKTPADLAAVLAGLKQAGKRIVHCHGVFDLIHPGHVRHLEAAKREGDVLVVSLTADRFVNKGPGRPVFHQGLRAESLAALQCVDYVTVNDAPSAVPMIERLRPDVYIKGGEYAKREDDVTGAILDEERAIVDVGGRIHFTDDITFSSSHLLNTHFSVFSPETEAWIRGFKQRYSIDDVTRYVERAGRYRALVVGDAIVDEYVSCDALGKSSKDPILAFLHHATEAFAGGSLAVANHLAGFCSDVGLVTFLGDRERREDLVRQALLPNVRPHILTRTNAPTIHKRRFVDYYSTAKIFELYVMDDTPLVSRDEAALIDALAKVVDDYDVVVVADYGHGMLTPAAIELLCRRARFLAVNTQANAGNRGFNTIARYPRADYVCLAAHEVALETRMRHGSPRDLVLEVIKRIDCPAFTVTQGKAGSLHYGSDGGFTEVPALATRVTDRVGAGDAFLAVSALMVASRTPWDVVGFVGNLAGAQMVAELGNRVTVHRASMLKHVMSLLK